MMNEGRMKIMMLVIYFYVHLLGVGLLKYEIMPFLPIINGIYLYSINTLYCKYVCHTCFALETSIYSNPDSSAACESNISCKE